MNHEHGGEYKPHGNTWYARIARWMRHREAPVLVVGERSARWVQDFSLDLERWGFNDVTISRLNNGKVILSKAE